VRKLRERGDTAIRAALSVVTGTLAGMQQQVGTAWVCRIAAAARGALEVTVGEVGAVPPPTVHILAEDLDQPYIGRVGCRPFFRGADAAGAVTGLGELPSVLAATRLVVTWEAQDLTVALGDAADQDATALVVLDATLTGHTMHAHPLRMFLDEHGRGTAEWGTAVELPDRPLPEPIAGLLAVWREWRDEDLDATARRAQAAGYRTVWAQR
jgi:hypothetical protein